MCLRMLRHLLNTMPYAITKLAIVTPPTPFVHFHNHIQNICQPRQISLLFIPGFKIQPDRRRGEDR